MINNETYIKILRTSTYYCGFKAFKLFYLDFCIYYYIKMYKKLTINDFDYFEHLLNKVIYTSTVSNLL